MRSSSSQWRNKANSARNGVNENARDLGQVWSRRWASCNPNPPLTAVPPSPLLSKGCSAVTSNRFALDFSRANVHGKMISTLHQHIFREIKSCSLKHNCSHQKCPTFIQLRNINRFTALICLQSGCSAFCKLVCSNALWEHSNWPGNISEQKKRLKLCSKELLAVVLWSLAKMHSHGEQQKEDMWYRTGQQ